MWWQKTWFDCKGSQQLQQILAGLINLKIMFKTKQKKNYLTTDLKKRRKRDEIDMREEGGLRDTGGIQRENPSLVFIPCFKETRPLHAVPGGDAGRW